MKTGQVPKKTGYFLLSRARVLGAAMAVLMGSVIAGLIIVSGLSKSVLAAVARGDALEVVQKPAYRQVAQDVVVSPVKRQRPGDGTPVPTDTNPQAPAQPSDAAPEPAHPEAGIFGTIQDWLARANREYQGIVVKELSSPSTAPVSPPPDDPIAKKLDEQQQDEARASAAAKAAADSKAAADKRAAEAKRLADDRRRAEETKRLADEASRKADEILKDVTPQPTETVEQQHREAQKLADENRRQEEQRQAEAQRRIDAERKRVAAAEAARAEAARADAADQEAERRRAEEAQNQMHRQRTIQLTSEPIERPSDRGTLNRPELASERVVLDTRHASYRPMVVMRPPLGAEVKHWSRRIERRAHSCRGAGRRVALPGRYTVKRGDSLWRIAKRHYHKGKHYTRIYAANRDQIRNRDLIYPCQRVLVPRKRR